MSSSCASASAAALVGGARAKRTHNINISNNKNSRRASTGSSASFTGRRSEGTRRGRGRGENRLPTAGLFFSSCTSFTNDDKRRGDFACDAKAVVHPNEQEREEQSSTNDDNKKNNSKYYPLIKKGDAIPNSSLQYFDHEGNLQSIETATQLCAKGRPS